MRQSDFSFVALLHGSSWI